MQAGGERCVHAGVHVPWCTVRVAAVLGGVAG